MTTLNPDVPVDFAVIKFPGNQLKGEIAPEIYQLVEDGLIRVVDVMFISKDKDGGFTALELNDLPEDLYRQFVPFGEQLTALFTDEDVETAAELVPPDSAALVLLWQNVWTERLREAVRHAGGQLVSHERIPAYVMMEVFDEMKAGSIPG